MNAKLALGTLGAMSLLVGAGNSAEAQIYQDLNNQLVQLTGVLTYQISLSVNAVILSTSTNITGTSTLTSSDPLFWTFKGDGGIAPESLSATIPLPSLSGITLPALAGSGTENRDNGVFAFGASLPGTTVEGLSLDGFSGTISITNPVLNLNGVNTNTPSLAVNTAIIQNTQPAVLSIGGLHGCINVIGCDSIDFESYNFTLSPWTITAVPGPSSAAILLPGLLASASGVLMRRRRSRLKS